MFSKTYTVWFLLCFNAVAIINSEEYFKGLNLECSPSPKYFINHSCRLKAVNRYKSVAFMETLIKDILRNVTVNIALYMRNDANKFMPFLVNITQNMCWYMDRRARGPYFNVFMKSVLKYTNINHSCPLAGPLIAHNLYIERSLIPVAFPRGIYKFIFTFYEGYPLDYIGKVGYTVEIAEKKITKQQLF